MYSPLEMESTEADRRKSRLLDQPSILVGPGKYHDKMGPRRRRVASTCIVVKETTGKATTLEVDLLDTIHSVKTMIEESLGCPCEKQRLIFRGKQLQDENSTLADYKVQNQSTIYLVHRLRGGGGNISEVTVLTADQPKQHQKRCYTYSVKALWFAVTLCAAHLTSSALTSFSIANMAFLIISLIVINAILSTKMAPNWGSALIYVSCFLLVLGSYLWLVSIHKLYSYAIFPVPLPIAAALLQHKFWSGVRQPVRSTDEADQQDVRKEDDQQDVLKEANQPCSAAGLPASADKKISKPRVPIPLPPGARAMLQPAAAANSRSSEQPSAPCSAAGLPASADKKISMPRIPMPLPLGAHYVDIENADQDVDAHDNDESNEHLDSVFELSSGLVNCGGFIAIGLGPFMVGPVSAVGFFFFFTILLGHYLMMVTTVRNEALTPHVKPLAFLLKVLLAITLITALIHGVRR